MLCICTAISRAEPVFERASPDRKLYFPADHGSHPNFKTEWWYFTGNLYEKDAIPFKDTARFGYQLTFFRQKETDQGYLAHAALSDFKSGKHYSGSLTAPGTFNFAGAATDRLFTWNRDWSAEMIANQIVERFAFVEVNPTSKEPNASVSLRLILDTENQPLILQGDGGYSKKGNCSDCASHYMSFTRLPTKGNVYLDDQQFALYGFSWMDHEFMSNTLTSDQTGWDWFSLMTKDNTELMLFRVRSEKEGQDFSSGTCIKNGKTIILSKGDFSITPTATWKSQKSSATYPSSWKVSVPACGLETAVKTRSSDQELTFPDQQVSSYYEGGVHSADESVIGYVELTGYAQSLNKAL